LPTEREKKIMAKVSLLGVPHDENSSYKRGSAEGPAHIRREMFSDVLTSWAESGFDVGADGAVRDCGNIAFDGKEDAWAVIEREVARALDHGDPLLCLGGDHAITHPIMRAVRARHSNLTIVHIDAHPDIYHVYQGNMRSHTSPFARIMEERLADRLIQLGLRTVNDHHRDQFARFGVETFLAGRCNEKIPLNLETPVYLTVDIDALDPAFAPGVAHREPGGLSTRQVIDMIQSIDQPIVAADVVEFNPGCDIAGLTAGVAAKLAREILGMMVKTAR
jgi:arginase